VSGRKAPGAGGAALLVIAKSPVPGRVKTRLSPDLDAATACEIAWASLLDTLDVAASVPASHHVLVLDGDPGPWVPPTFEVVSQRGEGLGDRLAAAFADSFERFGPAALLIAMDTPQVRPRVLGDAAAALDAGAPSVLGPATDGGFWAVGLRSETLAPRTLADVFAGIPMSTDHTGAAQHRRLCELGCAPHLLPELRDLDDVEDLRAIAGAGPRRLDAVARRLGLSAPTREVPA
jgi:rSAM/selenodomain-associated transferase 1